MDQILLQRECTPGIDASYTHLAGIQMHPGLAFAAVVKTGLRQQFVRVVMLLPGQRRRRVHISGFVNAQVYRFAGQRQGGAGEQTVRDCVKPVSVGIGQSEITQIFVIPGLLRTDISPVILPAHIA